MYIFHGWPNMCATSQPLELRFHAFLVVLLTTRKCHNSLENHGRNEHHTFFIVTSTKAFSSSCLEREHHWSSHGAVAVTTASTKLHPQGFNNSQSNALHMTLLHPPTPPSLYHKDVYSTWQDWGFLEAPGNPQPWPYIYIYISLCGGFDGWLDNSSWPFHYKLDMLWGVWNCHSHPIILDPHTSVYTHTGISAMKDFARTSETRPCWRQGCHCRQESDLLHHVLEFLLVWNCFDSPN